MTEELLEWRIENRRLRDFSYEMEEIYIDLCILEKSFVGDRIPDIHQKNKILQKIDRADKSVRRLNPRTKFDKLVQKNFIDSLWVHRSWIELFLTKKGTTVYGVRNLLNEMFIPQELHNTPHDVFNYLRNFVRNINYTSRTKLDYLMRPIKDFRYKDYDCEELRGKIKNQFPWLKKIMLDFNQRKEFITAQQKKELEFLDIKRNAKSLKSEDFENVSEEAKLFDFDIKLSSEDGATANFDLSLNILGLSQSSFYIFKDQETREDKMFLGKALCDVFHENAHALQKYLSRFMPPGIRYIDGNYDFFSGVIEEGLARYFETVFINYAEEYSEEFSLSEKDIERMKLFYKINLDTYAIDAYHALLHREKDFEIDSVSPSKEDSESNDKDDPASDDYDVHEKLARDSGNWSLRDSNFVSEEDLFSVIENFWDIFGERYINETLEAIHLRIKRKLQGKYKRRVHNQTVTKMIKRNSSILSQLMFTGFWGWSTHKDFVLLALDKAWKDYFE